ncbi:MAG: transposase family protein [Pseudonocardiaceae bacterium]
MYHTTGCSVEQLDIICGRIAALIIEGEDITYPPSLGLRRSVVIALTYLKTNRREAELAEDHGTSQPTVSRAITGITPSVCRVLSEFVPTAEELEPDRQYVVDGSLLPCWSWRSDPDLYSGKHKTTGMNVQFACTISGELAWISDPLPGSRHDTHCLRESGALDGFPAHSWIGDKGYLGLEVILTPIRKPANGELLDWEKEFNTQINKIRYVIERAIANFKAWRVTHTDYRRPLNTFAETISTVIALQFFKLTT